MEQFGYFNKKFLCADVDTEKSKRAKKSHR
jgi:hypothetical protein